MINLLPPEIKSEYSFARRNVGLRKWVIAFLIALIGLGGMATFGLVSMRQAQEDNKQQIAAAEKQLRLDNYEDTQKRVKEIGDSFKLVVKVLGQEILFSKLIQQIGTAMPPNSSLAGLNISQTQGAIDITADAIDYQTATQIQVNLSDPDNKIFAKADIVNINCEGQVDDANASKTYPCNISIRALFTNDNPYYFINSKGKTP